MNHNSVKLHPMSKLFRYQRFHQLEQFFGHQQLSLLHQEKGTSKFNAEDDCNFAVEV